MSFLSTAFFPYQPMHAQYLFHVYIISSLTVYPISLFTDYFCFLPTHPCFTAQSSLKGTVSREKFDILSYEVLLYRPK